MPAVESRVAFTKRATRLTIRKAEGVGLPRPDSTSRPETGCAFALGAGAADAMVEAAAPAGLTVEVRGEAVTMVPGVGVVRLRCG